MTEFFESGRTQQALDNTALICSVLRGEPVSLSPEIDAASLPDLVAAIEAHGATGLFYERAINATNSEALGSALISLLSTRVFAQAAQELVVKRELARLLSKLAEAGVQPVLLKGAPLAYTVYSEPYLRSRGDTDVLVAESQRQLAHDVLVAAGYEAGVAYSRELESYQRSYQLSSGAEVRHLVDLHWRMSNRQIFSRLFSWDELQRLSEPVPRLSAHARAPVPVLALLIACLHRASHVATPYVVNGVPYCEANRLIWLYDIHLLCRGFSASDWEEFGELAAAKALRAVCLDGLRVTRDAFATLVPAHIERSLASVGSSEPSASYLRPGFWRRRLVTELGALPTWRERIELMGEWAFPPAAHMFKKYGTQRRWLLPSLYLRRAFDGCKGLIKK